MSGVSSRVHALREQWEASDGSASDRERASDGLSELRRLYRQSPEAFDAELLKVLKAVALSVGDGGQKAPAAAPPDASRKTPQQILEEVFGYPAFRRGQKEIIDAVLGGRDCVGVMPTGAGKSLTYQILSLIHI